MMENNNIKINQLPTKTWNFLKMNETSIRFSEQFAGSCRCEIKLTDEEVLHDNTERVGELKLDSAMSNDLRKIKDELKIKPDSFYIKPNKNLKEPIKINFQYEENKGFFNLIEVYVGENSTATIIMDYQCDEELQGSSIISTNFYAAKNARINIVQIERLGQCFSNFNDIAGRCEKGAVIEIKQLILGGKNRYYGCMIDLQGSESSLDTEINYIGADKQKLDMNYVAQHKGEKTKSSIKVNGSLHDEAFKLFRGTIDFKRGSAGAIGKETEEVLLMGDKVINKTIPLILCKEEDVVGSHGATIGELNEGVLFYLASRGIKKEEAYYLIEKSRINALCRKIDDEEVSKKVNDYLERNKKSYEK